MYVTVLKANVDSVLNRQHYLNFFDGGAMHKWLTMQQDSSRANGGILYRVMQNKNDIFIYVQTYTPFNLQNIEKYGLTYYGQIDVEDLLPKSENQVVTFDAVLWPSKKHAGKDYYLKDEEERRAWVENKFEKNGATVISMNEYGNVSIQMKRPEQEKKIKLTAITVRGTAVVSDVEKFAGMIGAGVGKLKNFGAGMILFK